MTATLTEPQTAPTLHRFTVEDYHRMIELGILAEGARVELVEGVIVQMAAMNVPHSNAMAAVILLLVPVAGPDAQFHNQCPISLGRRSELEPDVALVRRHRLDSHPLPEDILLLVEIADSSLEYDRDTKFPIYAAAGIAESWLVDVRARTIERHIDPRDGRYTTVVVAGRGEALTSTTVPGVTLAVDTVFANVRDTTQQ